MMDWRLFSVLTVGLAVGSVVVQSHGATSSRVEMPVSWLDSWEPLDTDEDGPVLSAEEIERLRSKLSVIDDVSDETGIRRLLYGMHQVGLMRMARGALPLTIRSAEIRSTLSLFTDIDTVTTTSMQTTSLSALLTSLTAVQIQTESEEVKYKVNGRERKTRVESIVVQFQTAGGRQVQLAQGETAAFKFRLFLRNGSRLMLHEPVGNLVRATVLERGSVSGLANLSGKKAEDVDRVPQELRDSIGAYIEGIQSQPLYPLFVTGRDMKVEVAEIDASVSEENAQEEFNSLSFANVLFLPGMRVQLDGTVSNSPMVGTLTKSAMIGGVRVKFAY